MSGSAWSSRGVRAEQPSASLHARAKWPGRAVRAVSRALAMALVVVLVAPMLACGGGGASQGSTTLQTGADATHGALTLGLSGGAQTEVDRVWVTVGSVALHASATQAWSSTDRSWVVLTLRTPVVVELTAVSQAGGQSDVTRVLDAVSVPAGNYGQMRLFPLAQEASLSDAASAAGLAYNAQVRYTDASLGVVNVPLELPQPTQGWRVEGPFPITAGQASYLVLQSDVQRNLVRLDNSADGLAHFSWQSELRSHDLTDSPAILGTLDPSRVCGGSGAPAAPNCASDIIVSAQRLSADGSHYERVRQTRVNSAGGFALYPLPSATQFDVVITGRHMQTMLVRGVTVSPFNALAGVDWTVLGSSAAALQPVIVAGSERSVSLATPVVPGSGLLRVGQTVAPNTQPHSVARVQRNPLSGLLARDLLLPQGPVSVATFVASNTALSFVDVDPTEGAQAMSFQASGRSVDDDGAVTVATPAAGTSTSLSVAAPTLKAAVSSGQLQVTLTGTLSGGHDQAWLVVSDVDGVVLAQAATQGTHTLSVPVGAAAATRGGAIYSVAVRATRTAANAPPIWVRAAGLVDLRASSSASLTLALP